MRGIFGREEALLAEAARAVDVETVVACARALYQTALFFSEDD